MSRKAAKKFSGKLEARLGPKLHERLAETATRTRASMNELLVLGTERLLGEPEDVIVSALDALARGNR